MQNLWVTVWYMIQSAYSRTLINCVCNRVGYQWVNLHFICGNQRLPQNISQLTILCVYPCPTWSVWALQPESVGSRGPVPQQAPPECGCRQPRWCSCPVAPSIHSLMPCCPEAPGAQSLTWSGGTQFSKIILHNICGVSQSKIWSRFKANLVIYMQFYAEHFTKEFWWWIIDCKENYCE